LAKYKGSLETLTIPAIVVLVGLTAFGLGRLSALEGVEKGGLTIIAPPETQAAAVQESARRYVASKSGTRYYLPSCSGASRIQEGNKVWFATKAQAEAAGYTAASGCPGL